MSNKGYMRHYREKNILLQAAIALEQQLKALKNFHNTFKRVHIQTTISENKILRSRTRIVNIKTKQKELKFV